MCKVDATTRCHILAGGAGWPSPTAQRHAERGVQFAERHKPEQAGQPRILPRVNRTRCLSLTAGLLAVTAVELLGTLGGIARSSSETPASPDPGHKTRHCRNPGAVASNSNTERHANHPIVVPAPHNHVEYPRRDEGLPGQVGG